MNFIISYNLFKSIADGMILAMLLYALLNYVRSKNSAFALYGMAILSSLTFFYHSDHIYQQGMNNTLVYSFEVEIQSLALIFYCLFSIKMFLDHVTDGQVFVLYKTIIIESTISIILQVILKSSHYQFLVTPIYVVALSFNFTLLIIIFYKIYKIKDQFSFVTYYFIGSSIICTFFVLQDIILLLPNYPQIKDLRNAFTVHTTYGRVGIILESIFIFMGISASHKLAQNSKKEIQQKIIYSFEEKNKYQKGLLATKQTIHQEINTTFSTYYQQVVGISLQNQELVATQQFEELKKNIETIQTIENNAIETIRTIVRNLTNQSEGEIQFSNALESEFFETAQYYLQPQHIDFDLHLRPSDHWAVVQKDFEKEMMAYYESLLKILLEHKTFTYLIINLMINKEGKLIMIFQDDGYLVKDIKKMYVKLNQIATKIQELQGVMQYAFEKEEESFIQLEIPFTVIPQNKVK